MEALGRKGEYDRACTDADFLGVSGRHGHIEIRGDATGLAAMIDMLSLLAALIGQAERRHRTVGQNIARHIDRLRCHYRPMSECQGNEQRRAKYAQSDAKRFPVLVHEPCIELEAG